MLLPRLKRIGCRGETRWGKFFTYVLNKVIRSSIEIAKTATYFVILSLHTLHQCNDQNVAICTDMGYYRYNMPLLEAVGMTPTGKNFFVTTALIAMNRKAHRSECVAKLTELVKDKEVANQFINGTWHILINEIDEAEHHRKLELLKTKVWTSKVLHFGVETTKYVESEYSVLKLWLSTCHKQCHIGEYKQSHHSLGFEEDIFELNRAREIVDDVQNKCGHYLRKSHGLPCACELLGRYKHFFPLQLEDVSAFSRILEIGVDVPSVHAGDMDPKMRDLASILDQISTGPISKVKECRCLIKGFLCSVLPEDPVAPLTSPHEHAVTKG
ncbi:hypothetical protein M9H77_28038 [Catharanthus roseus]|uniref:Uncharacterized protein n=1 Tax=Catharanthus roseus TaxID=4058 RepID=A0ACC0AEE5_CATRO|nr:hypothetical protein M9H77_28038 [Catharanthus roseus]